MVSIIMPVFNGQKFIHEAIESILAQTYYNWELIIIDDGSVDETASIVKMFHDKRIHYVFQYNQGPATARNRGFEIAKGEFIAFLDADDLYLENKLEEQIIFLEQHPEIYIIYNDVKVVDEFLNYQYLLRSEGVYEEREDFLAMLLFRQIVPLPSSIMLRKKCFEQGIKYDTNYIHGEDYELTIQLARKFHFGYLPKALYIYRRHEKNLTNNHKKQLEAELQVLHSVGYSNIEKIVENSTFSYEERKLLLAKIYLKLKEYKRAKPILLEIYNGQSNKSLICFYLGNCAYEVNNLEEAKIYYDLAVIHGENMAEVYNNLGCLYGRMGEFHKAHSLFDKALAIRPGYIDTSHNKEQIKKLEPIWKITTRELRKTITQYYLR